MAALSKTPSEIAQLVESFDIYMSGDPSDFGSSIILSKSTFMNISFEWSINTQNIYDDFCSKFELSRSGFGEFNGTVCFFKTAAPGSIGAFLSGSPGTPIGFFPQCSVNGVQVTEPLNSQCFIGTAHEVKENISLVGDTLQWSFDMPGGGSQGEVEWARARICHTHEKLVSGDYVREHLMIPDLDVGLSGVFDKTWVRDFGAQLRPDGSGTTGEFRSLPSGQYVYQFQIKQSCNPHPYVSVSGFTVGATPPFSLNMAADDTDDIMNHTINFTSSRADSEPEGTKRVSWDFGNVVLLGNNSDIYRNPTYIIPRQGFYNPVVTYELNNGYILSDILVKQYGQHIREHRSI